MKRFYSITHTLIAGMLMLAAVSCTDFFNPDIDTALSEKNSYSDFLSSRAAVNGLYAQLQDMMTAYVIHGELRGDLLQITNQANGELSDIYRMDIRHDNKYLGQREAYKVISSTNDVLHHLGKLGSNGTTFDDELANMQGEALLVRSWVYFYLLRTFDRVPYLTEDFATQDANSDIIDWLNSKATSTVTIDLLIQDVRQAIPKLIPAKFQEGHFFNLASANAMLGEIFLWKNDYRLAADAFQAAVATADTWRFILDADHQNARWVNIFLGDESATDEIMTKIVFNHGEKQGNELMKLFSAITPGGYHLKPTPWIISQISSNIHRRNGSFKNGSEVGKYTRSVDDPYISDMPVLLYRAADIHLYMAEALNRLGHVNLALDLINNGNDSLFTIFSRGIRGRVGLPRLSVSAGNRNDSILVMENIIMEERARELAFEGKRWFDILRIAQRRDDSQYIIDLMRNKYHETEMPMIINHFEDKSNWHIPFN